MFYKRSLRLICLLFTVLTLLACGLFAAPDPTPIPPTETATFAPPTATLTSIPPSITPTPTPIIALADATFSGTMTLSTQGENASAEGAEIEFKISPDGTEVLSLSYSLEKGKCLHVSGSSTTTVSGSFKATLFFKKPIPIKNGKFIMDFMGIRANGTLISPSEAYGEITIDKEETSTSPSPQKFTCHYGTWTWIANAE